MKRRDFIVNSTLATGAIFAGAPAQAFAPKSANDKLRVALIGAGSRGTGLINIMRDLPGVEIAACCEIIPFRLEKALSNASAGAKGVKEYQKILDDKSIDAVIIATPYRLHADIAIDAVDAGKHVYCEKTMVHSHKLAKKLTNMVADKGIIFQTGHQYHSSRLYLKAVELIQNGYIGDVAAIDCQWNRNGDWRRSVPDPKWERMINWRMYREYSGGLMAELCSHQADFCNWVLQDRPKIVTGFGGINSWKDGRETYDNIRVLAEYTKGVKVNFTSLTTNAFNDYQIKVMGKEGTIILDYRKAIVYSEKKDPAELGTVDGVSGATVAAWSKGEGVNIDYGYEEPTKQALMDFADCIRNNQQPITNVKTGGLAAICVEMGLNAMDSGKPQKWKSKYDFALS